MLLSWCCLWYVENPYSGIQMKIVLAQCTMTWCATLSASLATRDPVPSMFGNWYTTKTVSSKSLWSTTLYCMHIQKKYTLQNTRFYTGFKYISDLTSLIWRIISQTKVCNMSIYSYIAFFVAAIWILILHGRTNLKLLTADTKSFNRYWFAQPAFEYYDYSILKLRSVISHEQSFIKFISTHYS